jgi:hexokinase
MERAWERTLNAKVRKLLKKPAISIKVEKLPESQYRVLIDSDHQDFISLEKKLEGIVIGTINRRNLY